MFVEDDGAKSQDRVVGQFVCNMAVGVVTEIGAAVTRFRMGDRGHSGQGFKVRWLQVLRIGVKYDTSIRYL